MQIHESAQSYLPVVPAGNELPKTTSVSITVNANYQAIVPNSSSNVEDFLVAAGEYYAVKLAGILESLKDVNEGAIYPITAILKPFFALTELDIRLYPPVSSYHTSGYRDNPEKESEDMEAQEESFFRFLDELESGLYAADDRADEE